MFAPITHVQFIFKFHYSNHEHRKKYADEIFKLFNGYNKLIIKPRFLVASAKMW